MKSRLNTLFRRIKRQLPAERSTFGSNAPHIRANKHCSNHRFEIERSEICGCFYCMSVFPPGEIVEWIDAGQSALCAKCEIDSVIGSASGYPITREFLEQMYAHWF